MLRRAIRNVLLLLLGLLVVHLVASGGCVGPSGNPGANPDAGPGGGLGKSPFLGAVKDREWEPRLSEQPRPSTKGR
jgi:hypothetical protein